ncbi:MAG TPA: hypothetical protein VJY35_15525 [Candidatus Eisenbacteria bacterium]|nr:hypothetical protein [Candidatus Eisenbacteria bacterium]
MRTFRNKSRRINSARWRTPFGRWVHRYGVEQLALDMRRRGRKVSVTTIYEWVAAHNSPRPKYALLVAELSLGAITVEDIYRHTTRMPRSSTDASE